MDNSGRRQRLGILLCGHAPEELLETFPDYDHMFQELLGPDSFDYQCYPVVDQIFPEHAHVADAWLISGSRHGVYEPHPWIPPLEDLIREAYAAGLPMVGVCFGHQILAQALGGTVEKFAGGWSVGQVEYALDPSLGMGTGVINAYHQDQVITPPVEARTVGSTDFCAHAALLYGDQVFSLQPHPEFSDDFVAGLLATRGKSLPADRFQAAEASLGRDELSQPDVAAFLRAFLQRAPINSTASTD